MCIEEVRSLINVRYKSRITPELRQTLMRRLETNDSANSLRVATYTHPIKHISEQCHLSPKSHLPELNI